MPEQIKRPLTDTEAATLRDALPPRLHHLIDIMFTVSPNCWNCEHFNTRESDYGRCMKWDDIVPMDKRKQRPDCFSMRRGEPF